MNERIGYPDFIKNSDKLNAKYEEVSFVNLEWLQKLEINSS